MEEWIWPLWIGLGAGTLLFLAVLIPLLVWQYRRYGHPPLRRIIGSLAVSLYAAGLFAYTMLPLPEPGSLDCSGGSAIQLVPFHFLQDIRTQTAGLSTTGMLTSRVTLQVVFNVVLFLPWGMLVRGFFKRSWLTATVTGGAYEVDTADLDAILARHVEGASHMAEGYTRAKPGNIGVCIGTSGPAGTDMITGLYAAIADSIPILCITGQAPRARLYKEDFQAVDIESIAKPVTKWAVTVLEPALVPRVFQQAFHVMRSGRPGPVLIDLPFDVQMAEIEFDIDTYEPLPVYKPAATRKQIDKALPDYAPYVNASFAQAAAE